MLIDQPHVDAITENAVKTYHLISQKEKGEDEIQDEHMHLNEFIDLVSCVEVQVVGGDLSKVELVYLDSTMPSTMAALLLSQPKRIAWRLTRILSVFAIMLIYIMFGGAIFQVLEQENDLQISREYLAEWEALSATIDESISEESKRKFTLDKPPAGFNMSTFNETGRARRKTFNETGRARRKPADMFDHPWFDAVSDELWSTQQYRRGLDGGKRTPTFDAIGPGVEDGDKEIDELEVVEVDEVVSSVEASGLHVIQRFKRNEPDTSARWTEKSQHWLTRGCNRMLNAADTAKYGNDDEALGKVACCRTDDGPEWLQGCRVKTKDNMCWGGDPQKKQQGGPFRTYAEALEICEAEDRRLCSKAEMDAEQTLSQGCCGTGCDFWDLHWTSDKRPVVWALPIPSAPPAHWLQPGCGGYNTSKIPNNDKRSMYGADDEALGRVECCSDIVDRSGKTCNRKLNGVCFGFVNDAYVLSTFAEATDLCEATGNRLCTKEETAEVAGACCNTGCNGDYPLTWTSNEEPRIIEVNKGKHYLEDGCPLHLTDPVPMLGDDTKKLGEVQCCSIYGGDCRRKTADNECYVDSTGKHSDPNQIRSATFAEAKALCAADGRVLCSREELEAEPCCSKGCGHDHALTWTRDAEVTTTTTTTTITSTMCTFVASPLPCISVHSLSHVCTVSLVVCVCSFWHARTHAHAHAHSLMRTLDRSCRSLVCT
jgi:hypothetical protein